MDLFFRRLSVRFRIIGSFLFFGILILVAIPLVATNFNVLIGRLQRVTTVETRADRLLLLASARIASSQVNLIRYIQDYTSSPAEALDDIQQAANLLTEAQSLIGSEEQVQTLDLLLQSLSDYRGLIEDIAVARASGDAQSVTRLQFQASKLSNDIGLRIELLVEESEALLLRTNETVYREARRGLFGFIIGSAVLLTLVVIWGVLVARSITRQVDELRAGAESLRRGKRDTFIPVKGTDELSLLARGFNQLTAELSRSYQELEQRVADRTKALSQRALELQTAAEVAREAASIRELQTLLDRAVNLILERFGLYHVSILLLDDQGEYAVLRAGTGEAGQALLQKGFKLKVGSVGIVGFVARSGEPRVVNDVDVDFSYYRDPLLPDTRAEVAVPLKIAGQVIGVLDVQSNRVNAFSQDTVAVLQVMADQLAVAIQNARLVQSLQDSLQEVRTLYARFAQEAWRPAVMGKRVGYEYDRSVLKPLQQRLSEEILAGLQSLQVIQPSAAGKDKKADSQPAALLAPLKVYDQLIGVLGVESDDPNRRWSEDELALVEAVSNQLALALDSARLLEETRLRTDQLRLLQEVTATAVSHVNLSELLQAVAEKLREGLDSLHCGIVLFDAAKKYGTVVADASAPGAPGGSFLGVRIVVEGNELTQEAIQTRKAVVVYDAQHDPRNALAHELSKRRGTQTLVVVPLVLREDVIGTIGLDIGDPERRFTADDLRLLDQISLQISASIEVARIFEQTARKAERERLTAEITTRMRETLDVQSVLETAADEIYRRLGLDEVSVYLVPAQDAPKKEA